MNISLIVSISAAIVAAGSMIYARSQVLEMKRQFREEGAVLKLVNASSPGAFSAEFVPSLHMKVLLVNRGRLRAVVKGITVQAYNAEYPGDMYSPVWSTDLEKVPASAGPVPPFEIPALDSIEWDWIIAAPLVEQAIRTESFNVIVPTVQLGDGSTVASEPIFVLRPEDRIIWKWAWNSFPLPRRPLRKAIHDFIKLRDIN